MALETGKLFDMMGYDALALVQHVTDDCVRLFVLHNSSSHVLVAEAHSESEPRDGMQEPARLVASFPYAPFEHGWRVAYKLALAEAVRRAHHGDDSCPGCGCMPGDGTTAGCTAPDGCGYFASCALPVGGGRADADTEPPRTMPVSAADVDAAAEHDVDARMAEADRLRDIAVNPDARD